MKLRSLIMGLTLLAAGTVIGVTTQQFASADVSSGDRPILVPIEPCRLVDTRPGTSRVGPRSSRLGAADTFRIDAQETATGCTGRIPAGALSLSLNVTAIGATELTFLTIWAGGTRPTASSLNPSPGAPPTPNAVTVDLSVDQDFLVYNDLGSLDLVVDVNGYYENHHHDDRYYSKAQVDTTLGSLTGANVIDGSLTLADLGGGGDRSLTVSAAIVVPGGECRSAGAGNSGASQIGKLVLFTIADAAGNAVIPNGATAVPSVVIGTSQGGAIVQYLVCNNSGASSFTIPAGSVITAHLISP